MVVNRIPRIILDGDEESSSYMAREGIRQLGILKDLMSFSNLQQDIRKVEYIDGSRIVCRSCFGEDVVYIYVPEEEEEREELPKRFYCLLEDGVFKWLSIVATETGVYTGVVCSLIGDALIAPENPYCIMIDRPYFSENGCAKAFMLEDKRYVASLHALSKDRQVILNALETMPPYCEDSLLPCRTPPLDWESRCLRDGMRLSYPPNRFLLNNDLLSWYHACEGFIFGTTFKLEKEEGEEREEGEETILPVEVHAFTQKWFDFDQYDEKFLGPDDGISQIAVYFDPILSIGMTPELLSTTEDCFEYYLDYEYWGEDPLEQYYTIRRPVKIVETLSEGAWISIPEETTHTEHWIWSEDGFLLAPFITLEEKSEDRKDILDEEDDISHPFSTDCSQYTGDPGGCQADNHHGEIVHEGYKYFIKQVYDLFVLIDLSFFDWSSKYTRTFKEVGDFDYIVVGLQCCAVAHPDTCYGPVGGDSYSITQYDVKTHGNHSDSLTAKWINSNVAQITQEGFIVESNCKNTLNAYNQLLHTEWPWEDPSLVYNGACGSFSKNTHFGARECVKPDCYCADGTLGDCYNEEKKWIGMGAALWSKEIITPYTENFSSVGLYDFDGKLQMPSTEVERYWYLDDLATEDSQGFLLAIKKADGDIEFHHRFSEGTEYRDITLDVFRALKLVDEDGVPLKDKIEEVGLI